MSAHEHSVTAAEQPDDGRLRRPALLVIVSSADLYASGRSLLCALPGLAASYDVTVLTPTDGPLLQRARDLGVDGVVTRHGLVQRSSLRPDRLISTLRNVTSTLRLARRLHRERRFVAIYAPTFDTTALPVFRRILGLPVIVHVRELPRQQPRQLAAHLRAVDRAAHRIVCNSAATARELTMARPALSDRVRVIVDGVAEPIRVRVAANNADPFHIVCAGRIGPHEGQAALLDAAAQAVATGADWNLHFWGSALPEHQEFADALRVHADEHGLAGRVTWHGDTAVPDALYDNAHVAVVSSMSPGEFSLGIAEAQIRGLPVVVVGPGEPCEKPDRADETVVLSGDVAGLRAALEHLDHHRELLGEWGETVRRTSCAQFGLDRYRREIVDEIDAGAIERPGMLVLTPSADLYGSDQALLHGLPALLEQMRVVVLSAVDGPFIDQARAMGATVLVGPDFAVRRYQRRPLSHLALAGRTVQTVWNARSLIRRHQLSTVYVNTVAVAALPLMRILRRPVVLHVHERGRGGWFEKFVIGQLPRFADHVLANSEFTRSTFGPSVQRRSEVVYNGVAIPPESLEIPDSNRVVVPARIHPKKGQPVLVDAVARLVARGVDIKVDVFGDALPEHAEYEQALRAQIHELGLEDHVRLLGHTPDVEAIYTGHGIAVVPSVAPEEFSLVAAEAQIRGLAVVATGPGGVCEVVVADETGVIVPAQDPDGLADGIERLLRDPKLRREMGERGRRRMLERFTVETYRARLIEAIAPVLSHD